MTTALRRWRAELEAAPDHVAAARVALAAAKAAGVAALVLLAALAVLGCAAGFPVRPTTSPLGAGHDRR